MDGKKFTDITDRIILVCLTIQIASVSISIAVSSVFFGIWISLWLIQIITLRNAVLGSTLRKELFWINLFIVLYILSEIISRIFAVYPEGAFANLKRLLLFLIFFVSVIKIVNKEHLYKIMFINLIVLSIISIIEIAGYAYNFGEMISRMPFSEIRIDYFSYPITSGEIKMMCLLSIFPVIFVKETLPVKKLYLVLLILPVFISMILTQSRNVFLAFFLCLLIYGIFVNRKLLLIYFVILIAGALILPEEYTSRIKSITDTSHLSNKSRIDMWKVGWEMFKDHPLTGVADSHIKEIYETYKKPEESSEGVHLHSNIIMILATTGITGFIAYCGIFISIFLKQIKYYSDSIQSLDKSLMFGSLLVFISFHISGIFEWNFGDHEVMTVFYFLISVPFVLKNINSKNSFSLE